ncbi:caspase family protein [Microbispora triticiradicis]|uniref:caspase family protein n=1 Tax=Microbispora triticiradicis TaxID=2200763 RepID=UPI001AD6E173|nr:caspase family protein [Microbispora triticiradicis]MBO4269097.1 hypothetical protein [Microbispora triticiradicis]
MRPQERQSLRVWMPPEMGAKPDARRFLIATAITRYPNALGWDRPGLVEARNRIINLFTKQLGYEHVTDLGLNPTAEQLTSQLRGFCKSDERSVDDLIVVYIAAHGEILDDDEHVLLTSDTDPNDVEDALATLTLAKKMLRGTKVRRLLLLLDTCYSGRGGNQLAASALQMNRRWDSQSGSGFVVICSAQPNEQAQTGAFADLLERAVTSVITAGHGPQALALDAVVEQMNAHPERPGHQQIGMSLIGLTGSIPPFLRNPRHDVRLTEVDLALQQADEWQKQAERRELEFRTRLLVRAMGSSDPDRLNWWFWGRHKALAHINRWLREPGSHQSSQVRPALAVTAGPGSGKTAVLGLIATLTHPERWRTVPVDSIGLHRDMVPAPDAIGVTIYGQNLTDDQVLQAICAAGRVTASTVGELLDALGTLAVARGRPLTVLIDALDEAVTPGSLCTRILRPLIDHARGRIRLLVGTRPHLLERLGLDRSEQVDLDAERYADPDALHVYTVRNLVEAHHDSPYLDCPPQLRTAIAQEVATAAGLSFLVARIAASTLAATQEIPSPDDIAWRRSLPRLPGEAMRRDLDHRLGDNAERARDLLRPLAFAEGQGLPWEDIWPSVASAISGRPYANDDLLWLRRNAGAYVVEATEADRSAYRLYHQALAEHLRDGDGVHAADVHAAIVRALISRVPHSLDGKRDWSRAHPYTLRHLATHAACSKTLDDLVCDLEYLVHADPDVLMTHLHTVESDAAQLPVAIYRASIGTHRQGGPDKRRQVLALDAVRYNAPSIQAALNSKAANHAWKPLHATGGRLSSAVLNTLTGHTETVTAVACTVLNGRPVVVSGSDDATVRVWDLSTGQVVGQPLAGHTETVNAVACTVLNGRPIAVTGSGDAFSSGDSEDNTVRVWDLSTGQVVGEPLAGHTGAVNAVACTVLNGRPVVVSGSDDATVRVWDLSTGQVVGEALTGHTETVNAVACTVLNGRPVVVSGSDDATVRVWDLSTGQVVGQPLAGHTETVNAVACTVLNGRPVVVSGSDDATVRVWDLSTGQVIGEPLTGHTKTVNAVACTTLNGQSVAIAGYGFFSEDNTVRVWDLSTGQVVGEPLAGHAGTVYAVACATLNGRPVVVSGSGDDTVRVWDLSTGQVVGEPLTVHTGTVYTLACATLNDRPIAITGSADFEPDGKTLRMWDLATGRPFGRSFIGQPDVVYAVACTTLHNKHVAVVGCGSSELDDSAVRIWDLTTGRAIGQPLMGHSGLVNAVACTTLNGQPVAVTGSGDATVRIWDLDAGRPIGHPLIGHTSTIYAVACTTLNGRSIAVTGSGLPSSVEEDDNTVRVWDLTTGRAIGQPFTGHAGAVKAVACTMLNGQPVAISGSDDATVRIWDLTTGRSIGQPFTGHAGAVHAVACSELNGQPVVVTGSGDATIRIWELASYRCMGVIYLPDEPFAVGVTDSGLVVCSFGQDVAVFSQNAGE